MTKYPLTMSTTLSKSYIRIVPLEMATRASGFPVEVNLGSITSQEVGGDSIFCEARALGCASSKSTTAQIP